MNSKKNEGKERVWGGERPNREERLAKVNQEMPRSNEVRETRKAWSGEVQEDGMEGWVIFMT